MLYYYELVFVHTYRTHLKHSSQFYNSLLNKINEMEEAFEKPAKGRPKKGRKSDDAKGLSRGNQKKVNEFMVDLKGLMEDIFEQDREDTLPAEEKTTCQTLLLTISVKEKIFNETQRDHAKKLLSRLEGDRRRKCRTSFAPDAHDYEQDTSAPAINPNLLIVSSKKKRKSKGQKKKEEEDDSDDDKEKTTKKRSKGNAEVDDDGFRIHSDDEQAWSDVDDGNKKSISMKQAKLRREWGAGKDKMKLAKMPWPTFPRHMVKKVLGTLLDEVTRIDQEGLGIFSVPVPEDQFPEYYELIKVPMDYGELLFLLSIYCSLTLSNLKFSTSVVFLLGTMKEKLERGEYRSAQMMQKDFFLIAENCTKFNAPDSDIVREAQKQTLRGPQLLKEAALKNMLFIGEE